MTIDEAKKLLAEMHGNCIGENILEDYDDPKRLQKAEALAIAIGALNCPQWIPCKEKLPEQYGRDVLLSLGTGEIDVGYLDTAYDEYGKAFCAEISGDILYPLIDVLAWMPLPSPYQEGSNV